MIAEYSKINSFYYYKLLDCLRKWKYLKANTLH